ncbi:hypothetical protein BDP81DRAFT_462207 [Colletotrichum phormii]|uniref:Uncharacterized protein n=1 Tax=Colletotrichum phormii TaxID=359342 RepID=A0AAJ0EFN8_9PEZI|nr:uncharacterized protein BDP81DRAFT_462207 [Colletotrichum phormii]KAK1635155.1 hypothetical protein BDP81DRAFT_462207 [Colletotrichum phormii]
MKHYTTILLALLGTAAAQTTSVISVLNPYFGDNPYDASIKDANPTATTYVVSCQTDSTNYQCRQDPSGLAMTLIGGPSTVELHIERTASKVSIEYIGTVSDGALYYHVVATKSGSTVTQTDTSVSPLGTSLYVPLTVTAGLEKLQQAQAGATTTAAATATATSTATSTALAQSGSRSGSGSGSAAATATTAQASSTSTPNAAAPRVGRDGVLVGAVAAAGFMMF